MNRIQVSCVQGEVNEAARVILTTDGSVDRNGMVGGWGWILTDQTGREIERGSGTIESGNVVKVESKAAAAGLQATRQFGYRVILLQTDSTEVYRTFCHFREGPPGREHRALWCLSRHLDLIVEQIEGKQNPAHELAYAAMSGLRDQERLVPPYHLSGFMAALNQLLQETKQLKALTVNRLLAGTPGDLERALERFDLYERNIEQTLIFLRGMVSDYLVDHA